MELRAAAASAPALEQQPEPDRVLVADLRSGRILADVPVEDAAWEIERNGAGSVSATVVGQVVEDLDLRSAAAAARSVLAVESEGRIWQAGPIWAHGWSWSTQKLTLGAAGLWSLFDLRFVLPVLAAGARVQDATTTVSNASLGQIARELVAQAMTYAGGNLPMVLPDPEVGTRTETFPGYALLDVGEQLRQLTKRQVDAPDIRFAPRRDPADPRFLQWVMQTGTAARPQLSQAGPDWLLDMTVPKTPVVDLNVAVDGSRLASRTFSIGNGQDRDVKIGTRYDPTLVDAGYPLLEAQESRSSVDSQAVLNGHAANLQARRSRPVESWTLQVRRQRAVEMFEGHWVKVRIAGDAYIPDGDHRGQIDSLKGGLGETVDLAMAPTDGLGVVEEELA